VGLTAVKGSLGSVSFPQATAFLRKVYGLRGEKKQQPTNRAALSISREQVVESEVAREFANPLISHFWHVPATLG